MNNEATSDAGRPVEPGDVALPDGVDRASFQTELDRLRIRGKGAYSRRRCHCRGSAASADGGDGPSYSPRFFAALMDAGHTGIIGLL
jgi:hypothetical protein